MAKSREYLDIQGLQKFWQGAKEYIDSKITESTGNIGALAERVDEIRITRGNAVEQIVHVEPGSVQEGTGEYVTIDLSEYAKKGDFTAVIDLAGTKTAAELALLADPNEPGHLTLEDKGKVFIVSGAGDATYPAGSEQLWTGAAFEQLGTETDLSGYYTSSEVNTILEGYYNSDTMDMALNKKVDVDDFTDLIDQFNEKADELNSEAIPDTNINALFS